MSGGRALDKARATESETELEVEAPSFAVDAGAPPAPPRPWHEMIDAATSAASNLPLVFLIHV